jgi:hypothetical protein
VPDADIVFMASPTEKAQQQHAEEAPKKETQPDPAEEASVELPAPPGGKKKIISSSRLAAGTVATTTTLGETLTWEPATWARIRAEKGLRARKC